MKPCGWKYGIFGKHPSNLTETGSHCCSVSPVFVYPFSSCKLLGNIQILDNAETYIPLFVNHMETITMAPYYKCDWK